MKCSSCPLADNLVYTSNPPQVKCSITGRFHFYDDECDCAISSTEPITVKIPEDDIDLEKSRALLEEPIILVPTITGYFNCLICGSEIPVNLYENHAKVCDDCKKAIMFIKEHFRYED